EGVVDVAAGVLEPVERTGTGEVLPVVSMLERARASCPSFIAAGLDRSVRSNHQRRRSRHAAVRAPRLPAGVVERLLRPGELLLHLVGGALEIHQNAVRIHGGPPQLMVARTRQTSPG